MPQTEIYRLYLLPQGAKPKRHGALSYQETLEHRCLECPGYGDCLYFASRIPWESFSCLCCPTYVKKHPRPKNPTGKNLLYNS